MGLLVACKQSPEDYVASASKYFDSADYKAAAIEAQNALQQRPQDAGARSLLGMSLLELGDADGAERQLSKAVDLGGSPERLYPALARALAESGSWDRLAARLADKTVADPAGVAEIQAALGRAYLALGRPAEARGALDRALVAHPDHDAARVGMARIVALEGDTRRASSLVDAVLVRRPAQPDALRLKAELALAQGESDEAVLALEALLRARPEKSGPRHALLSLLMRQGKFDSAARHLEDARKLALPDPRLAYWDALLALQQGRNDAARRAAQQARNVDPEHVPSLVVAAAIELRAAAHDTAESLLRKALHRAPGHIVAKRLLAELYLRTGRPDRALESLQPLIGSASVDAATLALAGEAYASAGDLERAAAYFQRARNADAENTAVRTRLAQVWLAAGDHARAVQELEAVSRSSVPQFQADVVLVVHFLQVGELQKALAAARALEVKQPGNPLAHRLLGAVHLVRGEVTESRSAFERALALHPSDVTALVNLARLDADIGAARTGHVRFERALAREPSNSAVLLAFAHWLVAMRADPREVEGLLEQAARIDPANPAPRIALVDHYLRARDTSKAVAIASEASAAMPDDLRVIEALGVAHQAAGSVSQAIEAFRRLVSRSPSIAGPQLRLAAAYAAAKDYPNAERPLRSAIALEPRRDELRRRLMLLLVQAGRGDQALAEARTLQHSHPKEALGFALEGDALAAQGMWRDAAAAYRSALARAPDTGLVGHLDATLAKLDRPAEAEQLVARWLREAPKDIAARAHLARRAVLSKDYRTATQHYRVLVEQRPADVVSLNNLAWAGAQLGDPEALAYAERAQRLAPTNPAVLDTLGWLLVEMGETSRGVDILRRAARLAPSDDEIRLHLATAYVKAGQRDAAKRELGAIANAASASVRQQAANLLQAP